MISSAVTNRFIGRKLSRPQRVSVRAKHASASVSKWPRWDAYRQRQKFLDTESYDQISVATFPKTGTSETEEPQIVFGHGYPGAGIDGLYLAHLLQATRTFSTIEYPGHGDAKVPWFFDHRIGTKVRALPEIFDAMGFKDQTPVDLAFQSVGADIALRYLIHREARDLAGPKIRKVHLISPLGHLLTPYKLYDDVHWDFVSNILRQKIIGRMAGFALGGYWWGMVGTYKSLFHEWNSEHLAEYRAANNAIWLNLFGLLGGWKSAPLLEGCCREEHRIFRIGRDQYVREVVEELGLQGTYRTIDSREKLIRDILKRSGVEFTVIVPENDTIYMPEAQRRLFEAMQAADLPVEKHEVANAGHMVMLEQDRAVADILRA